MVLSSVLRLGAGAADQAADYLSRFMLGVAEGEGEWGGGGDRDSVRRPGP